MFRLFRFAQNMQTGAARIENAEAWIDRFNEWYSDQIKSWIHLQPKILTEPGYTKLDEITLPLPGKQKSIITADMFNKERNLIPVSSKITQYMLYNKIKVILTGHQPCVDHPLILRGDNLMYHPSILYINGDTGFSKFDPKNPDDTRGAACHSLELASTANSVTVKINADLSTPDYQTVTTSLTVDSENNKILGDHYIGRLFSDGRLVQCGLTDGRYRLIKQQGYAVTYSILTKDELNKLLLNKNLEEAEWSHKHFSVY